MHAVINPSWCIVRITLEYNYSHDKKHRSTICKQNNPTMTIWHCNYCQLLSPAQVTWLLFLLFPLNLSTHGRKQKRAATLFLQQKTNKQTDISWRSKCCSARKPLPVTDGYWRQSLYVTESEQGIKYPYWKVHMQCPVQDVFLPGSLCGFSHCLIRRLLFINI